MGKCDNELYRHFSTPLMDVYLESDIDLDLLVFSLNTTLYSASVAAMPSGRPQLERRKKTLPLWNDALESVVGREGA